MTQNQDYEINLFQLFETLWKKKYTLIFITIISFLIGIYYAKNKTSKFYVSTPIKYGNQSSFIKYISINEVLNENKSFLIENNVDKYLVDAKSIFEKFIIEFQDYEEMSSVLRENKTVNDLISDLDKEKQKKKLFTISKSFTISQTPKSEWLLSFKWYDIDEGKYLFNKALKLTLDNIKSNLISDVNLLADVMNNKNNRTIGSINDQIDMIEKSLKIQIKRRLNFLEEHYALAKELKIEQNLLTTQQNAISSNVKVFPNLKDLDDLNYDGDSFAFFDNNYSNLPYYLRGYRAIEKEIEIITSRTKEERLLMSSGYISLRQKLFLLNKNRSSNQLKIIAEKIRNDNPTKWVNYNFDLANVETQNKTKMYLILSVILGLITGSIYILITESIFKRKDLHTTN